MLRTLPARSGFLWVLLACIFLAGCTRHPKYSLQTEAALERLDAELSRKDRYQQWRQAQNDSLRREVARARNAGDRAWRLFAVSQNYVTYQLDSAAYYVDRLYRLAASAGSEDIRRIALLADIDVWLGRGQLGLAEELFPQDRHCRHVLFGVCRMAFALLLDRCPACGRSRGRSRAVGMARYGDARQAHIRARAVGVDAGADRRCRSARQRPLR